MLHEFLIRIPLSIVNEYIDKLNEANIFNLFYDLPIENIKTNNGYEFIKKEEEVDLKIYFEEHEVGLPEEKLSLVARILNVDLQNIQYQRITTASWDTDFDDIDLVNGWKIRYIKNGELKAKGDREILFDPQGAFGTGLHGTTRNCLEIVLEQDLTDHKVADLGAGSGILSIAAALKNAKQVDAFDIEDVNRQIQYNASVNQVNHIRVMQADLLSRSYYLDEKYDFIFINIGGEETKHILKQHHLLESGCEKFLISGLVEWNANDIVELMEGEGFAIKEKVATNEWISILFIKNEKQKKN